MKNDEQGQLLCGLLLQVVNQLKLGDWWGEETKTLLEYHKATKNEKQHQQNNKKVNGVGA